MTDPATLFKALADPARIKILEFLHRPAADCCTFQDRVCACDLESLLGLSQPSVSHHMRILVQARLVRAEKEGRWMHYRLEPDAFVAVARWADGFANPTPHPIAA